MSEQPIESPAPCMLDARYGYIRRHDQFLRDYLDGKLDVVDDLYYRIVVGDSVVKVVSGAQLVSHAELFAEQRLRDTLRAAIAASSWPDRWRTFTKHALHGLAMYATPFVPIP